MYPKGSISSKIITEALKYLYHLNIFDQRQYGPTPFGLLEGHGSRLQLPFLEYINSSTPYEQCKWMFTVRNPNATDIWQVGDSCHQNGCWKMAITVEKDARLHSKHRHAFESTDFDRCGIVPLINRELNKCFAKKVQELGSNHWHRMVLPVQEATEGPCHL